MRRHRVMVVLAGAAAVWWAAPLAGGGAAVAGAAPGGHGVSLAGLWGRAIEVPGLGSLNKRGFAQVLSLSCPSAGNCAAGGLYRDGSGHQQAFVANERNGAWRKAIEVPGSGSLNRGGNAQVFSVSCPSAGDCAAGGFYTASSVPFRQQAFVASERNGAWGRAIEVPGSGSLNTAGFDQVSSVSCGAAGDCAAGGYYRDSVTGTQAFVASERNGVWRKAIEVPGSAALNATGEATLSSVSCPSAGNCAAVGGYGDANGRLQVFVASERNGVWRKAIEVPGTGSLNKAGIAQVSSVSCASAGNCAAGGLYRPTFNQSQAFVASERNGVWGKAIEVPGPAGVNDGIDDNSSVSCASAGNCAAGGHYFDVSSQQAFVVSERTGTWGKAIEVPGTATLNKGRNAQVFSVSCPSAGNCVAGGYYRDGSGHLQGFVTSQR